ncbi:MAG: hypoxanthine phosphoribosyltransferase, partial [Armatimonadota bacterium]
AVLKGSIIFLADLLRHLDLDLDVDFVAARSYGSGTVSSGAVEITKEVDTDVAGRDVVLVEDIVDTGVTLRHLIEAFRKRGAASVRVCTLLDKPSRRTTHVPLDYVGATIPDRFVVGYGMDFAERYRNVPFIGTLKPEVYQTKAS